MTNTITVEGLKKDYKDVAAVKGIDFFVEEGKLFAFLGPNGAGKSTTIDILCTLLKPTAGRVSINGHMLGKEDELIRREIGVVFQDSVLDPLLSVRENLETRARFYDRDTKKVKEAVSFAAEAADVLEFADRPYGKLSGGQRRRTDIARALVNTPKILFLDEPTTGLDPKTKEGVWQTIFKLQKDTGMTIFLTTHYMEEAAEADYIIILSRGEIAAKGTPYDLQARYSSDTVRIKTQNPAEVAALLAKCGFVCREKQGLLVADIPSTLSALPLLQQAGEYIESFEVVHGSMDDVFLNVTGGVLA